MTIANGLGTLSDYARRASAAVAAQQGAVPDIVEHPKPAPPSAGPPVSPAPAASSIPTVGLPPSLSPSSDLTACKPAVILPIGYTRGLGSAAASWALPAVAAFGLLNVIAAIVIRSRATGRMVSRTRTRLTNLANRRSTR